MCGTSLCNVWHFITQCVALHYARCGTFLRNVLHFITQCVAVHYAMCGTSLRNVWHFIAHVFGTSLRNVWHFLTQCVALSHAMCGTSLRNDSVTFFIFVKNASGTGSNFSKGRQEQGTGRQTRHCTDECSRFVIRSSHKFH
jgi:hypothetical protein